MNRITKQMRAITLAIATVIMLSGCQPNPSVPPVVGKGNIEDKIKDKTSAPQQPGSVQQSASPLQSASPQRVQKHLEKGKLIVDIDAVLDLPQAGKLPVAKVKPRKFTQAEADKIIRVLFQGKPAYKCQPLLTKDKINAMLLQIKAEKSQLKSDVKKEISDNYDERIKYYEELLAKAPDKSDPVLSDGKLAVDKDGGQSLIIETPMGKGDNASVSIFISKTGRSSTLLFTNTEKAEDYLNYETKLSGNPKDVKMTLDEAKALAEKTVRDLGSDLKLVNVSLGIDRGNSDTNTQTKEAYRIEFMREVNGVPSTYEQNFGGMLTDDDLNKVDASGNYIETHAYERIVIIINDTGILELNWESPDTMLETVSEDAQTLAQDQALITFENQFFIHNTLKSKKDVKPVNLGNGETTVPDDSKFFRDNGMLTLDGIGFIENVKTCTYHIDRIKLGLMRVAVKDKPDEFLIIPVWDFFGSATVEYTPESGLHGFTTTDDYFRSFLTINAIDGSIIDRRYGY